MKKITLFTLEYPPQRGGVGNYYAGLVKSLQPQKNVVVKVLPIDTRWFDTVMKMLLNRADMIWIGQILPLGTAAWFCNKVFKKRYFVSLHGMDINLAQKNRPRLTAKILDRAEFITVNSEYTKKQISNWKQLIHKIEVVYPCPNIDNTKVDPELIKQTIEHYKLANKEVLLSVGRLVERKGMQNVIQAMPELILKHPNLIYIIIGNGEHLSELQRMIQTKKLDNSVMVLTNMGNQELAVFYSLADIFIMPTIDDDIDVEGFGIVYLEAGIFGKPVIATPAGGAKEAVKNNVTGLLTTQAELANDISKLLNNKKLAKQLGSNAQRIISREYKYDVQVKKILQRI